MPGGMMPGMDPGAFGSDLIPDSGGDVSTEVGATDGDEHKTQIDPFEKTDRINVWTRSDIEELVQLFEGEMPEEEPWIDAFKEPKVRDALKSENKQEIWEAVEQYLIDTDFPPSSVRALVDILTKMKILPRQSKSERTSDRVKEAKLLELLDNSDGGNLVPV